MTANHEGTAATAKAPDRPFSLRLRLLLMASVVLLVALVAVGAALNAAHYRSSVSALNERMESYVYLVLAATEVDAVGQLVVEGDLGDPRLSQPGSGIYAHLHGSNLHWVSPSALGLPLPELNELEAGENLFREPAPGMEFFVFQYGIAWQLADENVLPMTVTILVDPETLQEQVGAFQAGLVRSLATAGIILVLAQILMIVLAFRPLRKVAQDVGQIESGRAARLERNYPRELEPLARNVNRLLDTEQANQERYRNALDALAHSLKTPLAVIRAGLSANTPESRAAMGKAADDMSHLIATRLHRAAASTRRTLAKPIRVAPEADRLIRSLNKIYSQKMISTEVNIPPELRFYGEKRDLLEIMGNLFENAFKYGGTKVRISAGARRADTLRPGLWIRVEDDGPGIDPAMREMLLERGVRGDERVEGHGLGLAIVLELVSAYGGDISISASEFGGAQIEIELAPS